MSTYRATVTTPQGEQYVALLVEWTIEAATRRFNTSCIMYDGDILTVEAV